MYSIVSQTFLLYCLTFACILIKCTCDELFDAVYVADIEKVTNILTSLSNSVLVRPAIHKLERRYGRTSLMMCGFDPQTENMSLIDENCSSIGKLLVASGADISIVDRTGWDALSMASVRGFTKYSTFLIDNGAEIDRVDGMGMTPLMKAAAHGHFSTYDMLLQRGASETLVDSNGMTALHFAIRLAASNVSFVPFLRRVLDVTVTDIIDKPDNDGRTPLMYAVINCGANYPNIDAVECLLKKHANPMLEDKYHVNVLAMSRCPEVSVLLATAAHEHSIQQDIEF